MDNDHSLSGYGKENQNATITYTNPVFGNECEPSIPYNRGSADFDRTCNDVIEKYETDVNETDKVHYSNVKIKVIITSAESETEFLKQEEGQISSGSDDTLFAQAVDKKTQNLVNLKDPVLLYDKNISLYTAATEQTTEKLIQTDSDGYLRPITCDSSQGKRNIGSESQILPMRDFSDESDEEDTVFSGSINTRVQDLTDTVAPLTEELGDDNNHYYSTLSDIIDINNCKSEGRLKCMSKKTCRISIASILTVLLATSVTVICIIYIRPGIFKGRPEEEMQIMNVDEPMQGSHTGLRFLLSIPSFKTYAQEHLYPVICNIVVVSDGLTNVTVTLDDNVTSYLLNTEQQSFYLPLSLVQTDNITKQKGILLTTNQSVSLYTIWNFENELLDVSWVPPIHTLGTLHVAGGQGHFNYIIVTVVHDNTSIVMAVVDEFLKTRVNKQTVHLNQYQTFEADFTHDITGSIISSNMPISVQLGSYYKTAYITGKYVLRNTYLNLPPVSAWGKTFVVPPLAYAYKYRLTIIQPDSMSLSASIKVQGNKVITVHTNSTWEHKFNAYDALLIICDRPCLVVQQTTLSGNDIAIIPAVEQYSRNMQILSLNAPPSYEVKHFLSIMINFEDVSGLILNKTSLFSLDQRIIYLDKWVVITLSVPPGIHRVTHKSPTALYGVIAHGVVTSYYYRTFYRYAGPIGL